MEIRLFFGGVPVLGSVLCFYGYALLPKNAPLPAKSEKITEKHLLRIKKVHFFFAE